MRGSVKSVATIVSAALVAVTTSFLVAQAVYSHRTRSARLGAELRTTVAANADRAAIALSLPVWSIDRAQIDRVVESTLRDREVYAVVVEAAGRVHAMARSAGWQATAFDGRVSGAGLLREVRDVVFDGERIGGVAVYVTPRFAEEQLRRALLANVLVVSLVDLAVVAILWLVLRRVVLDPLRAIERYADAVSSGVRPDPASLGTQFRGEMERLRASMEHMVALLDVRYAQLEAAESRIRALASRLQTAREDEKTRIARDLHDDLGQLLTAVGIELAWVEERLAEHPDDGFANALTDHVVEATRLAEETMRSVQRIAADLRPPVLDQLGLGAALREEARRFQERTGIPCEVVLADAVPDLDGGAAINLYRVAQEALTNVARHAQASRVTVTLAPGARDLSLRIDDDGRGLDGGAQRGPGALGLLGMRERAAMIGGEVTFAARGGHGTSVELRVPLARVRFAERRSVLQ